MKTVVSLKDLIKYVIFISIVYTLMIIIPSQKIITKDLILIVSIIFIGFVLIDCLCSNSELFTNINNKDWDPFMLSNVVDYKNYDKSNILSNMVNKINEDKSYMLSNVSNKINETKSNIVDKINETKSNIVDKINEIKSNIDDKINEEKPIPIKSNELNETTTVKYMNLLIDDLREHNVLNNTDIENIKAKMNSKILTDDEIIVGLEKLILTTKAKQKKEPESEYIFGNVSSDLYKPLGNLEIHKWDEGYNMLNTNKWQIPMPRPPVCINTTPCKVCPDTDDTYPLKLALWDNSRKISNTEISKNWANKQIDPNENIV
jgi:2C-methyl-D-erythritol 2,4-cyclodiphosphate synthase